MQKIWRKITENFNCACSNSTVQIQPRGQAFAKPPLIHALHASLHGWPDMNQSHLVSSSTFPCISPTLNSFSGDTAMATAALLLSTLPPTQRHGLLQYHHSTRPRCRHLPASPLQGRQRRRLPSPIRAIQETEEKAKASSSAEEITEKYGLEFGLWKVSR